MTDNLDLWNRVEKTDPQSVTGMDWHPAKLNAVDFMARLKAVTEEFGPVGQGWSYLVTHSTINCPNGDVLAVADVTIVIGSRPPDEAKWGQALREVNRYGPVRATDFLVQSKRVNDDAPKNALTDALGKAFSHMGFSADVYMNKFKDDKYVQQRKADVAKEQAAASHERTQARLTQALNVVMGLESDEERDAVVRLCSVDEAGHSRYETLEQAMQSDGGPTVVMNGLLELQRSGLSYPAIKERALQETA